jgi:Ca-activated chloride channel homolog
MMKRIIYSVVTTVSITVSGDAGAQVCGVALALAVDVSGSVSASEYRLQIDGLAAALRDEVVATALLTENARLMLVQWSGSHRQAVSVPWRTINNMSDIEAFALAVEQVPRRWTKYSTAIGDVLLFTARQFDGMPVCKRKIIDVSGDGLSNEGVPPENIRGVLEQSGFVVNALAIEGSEEGLTSYYRDFVIVGDSAFVMTANSFEEYPKRIRQKLLREVGKMVALTAN